MAAPEVTHEWYAGAYGGTLGRDAFAASLPHAVAEVGRLTWPNDPASAPEAYMRAVCAVVDVDAAWGATGGAGALSSLSAGTVSMSFAGGDGAASYDSDVARAAGRELAGSGLLYAGLGGRP